MKAIDEDLALGKFSFFSGGPGVADRYESPTGVAQTSSNVESGSQAANKEDEARRVAWNDTVTTNDAQVFKGELFSPTRGGDFGPHRGEDVRNEKSRLRAQAEIKEWARTAAQLHHRSEIITRDTWQVLRRHKKLLDDEVVSQEWDELDKMNERLKKNRMVEKKETYRDIDQVKRLTNEFCEAVLTPDESEEYVPRLRKLMDDVEDQLIRFKSRQRQKYLRLGEEAKMLDSELATVLSRFDGKWEHGQPKKARLPGAPRANKAKSTVKKEVDSSGLPPKIADIQNWIDRHGGVAGGWDDRDHQMFLKIKVQAPNIRTLVQRCVTEIPDQTGGTVTAHLQWYEKYLEMFDKKKELIREWKEEREAARRKAAEKEAEEEEKALREEQAKAKKTGDEQERLDKATRVREWKAAKAAEEKQKKLADERRREQARERAQKKHSEERSRLKRVVNQYHKEQEAEERRKEAEEAARKVSEQEEELQRKQEMKRIFKKQQEAIKQAREKRRQQELEQRMLDQKKAMMIEDSRPKQVDRISRNPSRLTQETAAQKKRREECEEEAKLAKDKYVKAGVAVRPMYMPSRVKMASWRS